MLVHTEEQMMHCAKTYESVRRSIVRARGSD